MKRIDADFAREVLKDLYEYRKLRLSLARLLWLFLGIFGGHRFYLRRPGTALLMLFTGGGGLVWWVVDAFLLRGMVEQHNAEQERRRAAGQPPLELDFMPSLSDDVLNHPPLWTREWHMRGRARRWKRLLGDVAVLVITGVVLGSLAGVDGAEEAIVAILVVIGITAAAGATATLDQLPGLRSLVRWSHRLRLFYYYNEPRSPLGLLLRPITAVLTAPFRSRDRAETRIYLQLGFVSTLVFLLLDVVPDLVVPLFSEGIGAATRGLVAVWAKQTFVTFVFTYAFATPIGAVLTANLLTFRTHTVPRVLSGVTLAAIAYGVFVR